MFKKGLAWLQRNERHLGAIVFVAGFVTDILTFTLLDISLVNLVFAGYLALAAVCILVSHFLVSLPGQGSVTRRTLAVILPLAAQYLLGNLLSGFLIFYTKSSVLLVSWPFIVLLLLVFIGNEWFRKYRDRIAFFAVLFFFSLYAYAIFALPLFIRMLGPWVFIGSTVISAGLFALFLFLLWKTGRARLEQSLMPIIGSTLAILIVMVASYFTGLVPPIPITLKDGGIYHGIERSGGNYVLLAEDPKPFWDIRSPRVHVASGETVYAFASVFAPIRFSTSVVHRWDQYDERQKRWVTLSRTSFPIAGGRAEGYRGYSQATDLEPGRWRVSVETPGGQVIGQLRFEVERVDALPDLHKEIR
ncbi:MAG: hypothetical protein AB199_02050 [Parcubacteria bacterium C7867-004]|nr:MAG: hypothetical protein AB199_02050 [Parcubacteria bacterium C7867-004]